MMDMQATGIKKDILQISTSDFTMFIDGNSQNKKYNTTNNNKNISAKIEVKTNLEGLKVYTLNSFNELEEKKRIAKVWCQAFLKMAFTIYIWKTTLMKNLKFIIIVKTLERIYLTEVEMLLDHLNLMVI